MTLTISSARSADPAMADPRLDDLIGGDDPAPVTAADRLLTSFGSSAQTLFAGLGRRDTVRAVVELALTTFRCGGVGVVLVDTNSRPVSAGASGDDAATADRLQLSLRQGPVLQAIERRQPVLISELRSDSRWRFWAPDGRRPGLPIGVGASAGGRRHLRFGHALLRVGGPLPLREIWPPAMVFAQLASIAIAVAQEREQLLQALQSRSIVGQAQGILMKLHGVTATQALTVLHRYAAQQDETLRALAESVIRDRGLPDIDSLRPSPALRS